MRVLAECLLLAETTCGQQSWVEGQASKIHKDKVKEIVIAFPRVRKFCYNRRGGAPEHGGCAGHGTGGGPRQVRGRAARQSQGASQTLAQEEEVGRAHHGTDWEKQRLNVIGEEMMPRVCNALHLIVVDNLHDSICVEDALM